MSWLDSFDPQASAKQFASLDVLAMQNMLKTQRTKFNSEQDALKTLKTALTTFRSALEGFGDGKDGIVKNSATTSQDGFLTLKPGASAKKGLYQIDVVSTANKQQDAFEKLTDDQVKNATGKMEIEIDGETVSIDMSKVNDLAGLADAINKEGEKQGLTASLVKQNGKVTMMLNGESGAKNSFTVKETGGPSLDLTATSVSKASDAEIKMGDLAFTSDTNNFSGVIPGVDFTVIKKTEKDNPIIISVENDSAETKKQVQSFIDAYNKVRSEIDSLTKSGSADNKGGASGRGPLAGDSGINALESQLNALIRSSIGGVGKPGDPDYVKGTTLADFGITSDKEGKLKLDSKKFDEAIKENPEKLNTLFGGDKNGDGIIQGMDKGLNGMLSTSTGAIKQRQESLDRRNEQLTNKESQIELRYNSAYERYLKQFSNMQAMVQQMQNTAGMFFG